MDLERAKEALINADKAGDVQAATQLANFIRNNEGLAAIAGIGQNQDQFSDFSDEELLNIAGEPPEKYSGALAPIGRFSESLKERTQQASDIKAMYEAGEITKPEEVAYLALASGGGFVTDIAGNILQTGLESANKLTGGALNAGISRLGSAVGGLPSVGGGTIGERIPGELGFLASQYQDFAQKNPRQALALESALNAAAIAPGLKYGEDIISSTGKLKKTISASKIKQMSSDEIRQKSSDLFTLARQKGGDLKPEFTDDLIKDFSKIQPKTKMGQIIEGESKASSIINDIAEQYGGKNLTFDELMEADEMLGKAAFSEVDAFGKMNNEGRKLYEMQNKLRSAIDSAEDSAFIGGRQGFEIAKEARKYWQAQAKLRDVERIIQGAADAQQPTTVLKNGFRRLRKDKRYNSFTLREKDAIDRAAETGVLEGFFKLTGSGLVPIIAGAAGAGASGPGGALAAIPAYAVQQGAKKVSGAIANRAALNVKNAIRAGVLSPNATADDVLRAYGGLAAPLAKSGAAPALSDRAQAINQRALEIYNKRRGGQ